MNDTGDPLADLAKSAAGVLAILAAAFAWIRGLFARREEREEAARKEERDEARRAVERAELKAAIDAVGAAVTKLEIAWQKSDRELALIAHTLGEKSARTDRIEGRLDAMEREFGEMREEVAGMRGYQSGVRKAP